MRELNLGNWVAKERLARGERESLSRVGDVMSGIFNGNYVVPRTYTALHRAGIVVNRKRSAAGFNGRA